MSRIVILGLYPLEVGNLSKITQPGDIHYAMNEYGRFYGPDIHPACCFNIHNDIMQLDESVSANITSGDKLLKWSEEYGKQPDVPIVALKHSPHLINPQVIFCASDYCDLFHMREKMIKSIFASTPAMMIAYALKNGHKHVHLHACNMKHVYLDFTTNTLQGEAITQTIPLLWFIDYLRREFRMAIEWPAEENLRDKYGNQSAIWKPSEIDVMYGEHHDARLEIQIQEFKEGSFTINSTGEVS